MTKKPTVNDVASIFTFQVINRYVTKAQKNK